MKKTIMVSSHILPELADICNKIGIIERGKLLFNGDVESAIRQVRYKTVYFVAVQDNRNEEAARSLNQFPELESVNIVDEGKQIKVTIRDGVPDAGFVADRLIEQKFRLKTFREEEPNLEDVFMRITKGITN
jgi:ABC-2 type transport system ATP-binding protein